MWQSFSSTGEMNVLIFHLTQYMYNVIFQTVIKVEVKKHFPDFFFRPQKRSRLCSIWTHVSTKTPAVGGQKSSSQSHAQPGPRAELSTVFLLLVCLSVCGLIAISTHTPAPEGRA